MTSEGVPIDHEKGPVASQRAEGTLKGDFERYRGDNLQQGGTIGTAQALTLASSVGSIIVVGQARLLLELVAFAAVLVTAWMLASAISAACLAAFCTLS